MSSPESRQASDPILSLLLRLVREADDVTASKEDLTEFILLKMEIPVVPQLMEELMLMVEMLEFVFMREMLETLMVELERVLFFKLTKDLLLATEMAAFLAVAVLEEWML